MELPRSGSLVVGARWRTPSGLVQHRWRRRHGVEHEGLLTDAVPARRASGTRGGTDRNGWFTFPWSGHARQAGFSYRGAVGGRAELDLVPLGEQHREPGDSVHPAVHPAPARDPALAPIPDGGLPALSSDADAGRSTCRDRRRCQRRAQGRRQRAPTRHPGAGDHDAGRPRLCRRQVLRCSRHGDGRPRASLVPRSVRPPDRGVDRHVPPPTRRHRLGPDGRERSTHRRRSVHEHQRRCTHLCAGGTRPTNRGGRPWLAGIAGRVGYDRSAARARPGRGRRLVVRRRQLHPGRRLHPDDRRQGVSPGCRSPTGIRTPDSDPTSLVSPTTSTRQTASCRSWERSAESTMSCEPVSAP